MNSVYFVRHGQSQANLDGVYAGWSDSPLTEKGRQQAREAGAYAKTLGIERIFSSDLIRAYETACIIADAINIDHGDIIKTPKLREVGVGKLVGTPERGVPGTSGANKRGYAYYSKVKGNPMGVEHIEDLHKRIKEFAAELRKYEGQTVLIAGHDISGLTLEQALLNRHDDVYTLSAFPNGEIRRMPREELL